MQAYNKAVGTVLGGIVGIVLMRFGLDGAAGAGLQPILDAVIPVLSSLLGTLIAPRNVH